MLRAREFGLWILSALLVLGGLAAALRSDAVRAAPAKSPQQNNVVISEFRTRGPGGANDEFIEIFNPTATDKLISNWEIRWSNNSYGNGIIYTFPDPTQLQPGQHFLVANNSISYGYSETVEPDGTYTTGLSDSGGIALTLPDETPVDQVGMSAGSIYVEGTILSPITGNVEQSYERGPGGSSGNCTDTDNNATDFHLVAPANPQNFYSPLTTACIGPDQTITFISTTPTSAVVGGATYSPTAAATSGLPVEFTIDSYASSFCSISAGIVSFTAAGTCVIDANQAGNANYNAASQVQQSFVVGKGDQTITFTSTAPANAVVGGATYTPIATANSGLTVNFTIEPIASSVCSISGGVISFDETGSCVIDANQAGNANYNPASQVQQALAVGKGDQTITFTSTAPASAVVGGATYTPTTAATSGLSVNLMIDTTALSVCSINAGAVSFIAAGTCVIDANQAGDDRYNAAPQVQQSFHVGQTATATPSAPAYLVISEFRSRGPNGADDEFVELYNPSGAAVNIGTWSIKKSSSCGTSISNLATIPFDTSLLAGQHYLVAATGSSVTGADLTYTASLADDGGLALVTTSGTVVDQVGMCMSTQYQEGTILLPLSGTSDQSYERKPGGATSCYDTNNNAVDFALISPANPQNKTSPIEMCAGVLPFTPTSTSTSSATPTTTSTPTPISTPISTPTSTPTSILKTTSTTTRTPTRTPTLTPTAIPAIPGTVVINEFLPHPHTDWNGDGTANTGDEYIELINMGTESINLKNWKLDDGGGSSPYTLPDMTLLSRQITVFYHSATGIALSDGGDTVRLFKPDGQTADIYTYPAVTAADRAWCRLPDGSGAWAFACRPSPGKPNTPIESGKPGPGSTPGAGTGEDALSACPIDSAPQSVLSAECNSPGTRMWGEAESGEIWLESRWKYNVFVE